MLTGDTLFIGDVGRPDLRAALGWSAGDLGAMLYDSLRDKAAGAAGRQPRLSRARRRLALRQGAQQGDGVDDRRAAARSNYALQPMTKAAFIDLVTADQPDAPPYFTYDAVLNSQERPTLDEALARELNPLPLDQRARAAEARRADAGHARSGRIRGRAPHRQPQHRSRRPIRHVGRHHARTTSSRSCIIADPGREHESAMRLGRIGFDQHRRLPAGRHAQPRVAARPDGDRPNASARRLRRSALSRGRRRSSSTFAAPRERAQKLDRRQRRHPAQSSRRAARRAAAGSAAARALRRRLSIVDRREPAAARRILAWSANSPAESPPGKRRSCRCCRPHRVALPFSNTRNFWRRACRVSAARLHAPHKFQRW